VTLGIPLSRDFQPADDSLRAVLDSVFSSGRYQWSARPDPLAFLRQWWLSFQHWLESLARNHPDLYVALIWVAVAVLAGVVLHASWVLVRVVRGATAPPSVSESADRDKTPDAGWFRAEAARLARQGRFPEAIRADFQRLILELDARAVVRFRPSKTPAEYAREPGISDSDRGWLADLVHSLYAFVYAGERCGPEEFAGWQRKAEWHAATR
jgi:hypothetical protein